MGVHSPKDKTKTPKDRAKQLLTPLREKYGITHHAQDNPKMISKRNLPVVSKPEREVSPKGKGR